MPVGGVRRRRIEEAAVVVLGTVVSVLVNLATSGPRWATVSGLVLVTGLLAGLAAWRAHTERTESTPRRPADRVNMRTGDVRGGKAIAVRGASGAEVDVRLRTGEVTDGGEVIGYDRR